MIFTNSRTIDNTKNQEFTLMSRRNLLQNRQPIKVVRPKTYLERKPSGPVIKKVKWGEPFWNLFHVLAEKIIVDDQFEWKKTQFLNMILLICRNLPCPDCANHATEYLNGVNFKAIRTKDQLKQLFYEFHNQVNVRRGVPVYPRDQLDSKYSLGITLNIIKEFMTHFESKYKVNHLLTNDFHRGGVAGNLKKWFNENIQWFAP